MIAQPFKTCFQNDWTLQSHVSQARSYRLIEGLTYSKPWSVRKMSRFIESALLGLPLGQVVVRRHDMMRHGHVDLIDGKRRLEAAILFFGVVPSWSCAVAPGFALRGLTTATTLEGATFDDLVADEETRCCLENAAMTLRGMVTPGGFEMSDAELRSRING